MSTDNLNPDLPVYGRIYLITNKVTGKSYVGQTVRSIDSRWKAHCTHNPKYQNAISRSIRKHGRENFTIQEVAAACSRDELNDLEAFYVVSFGTLVPSGYNLMAGGGSGAQRTARAKENMSAAQSKAETRQLHKENTTARWESGEYRARVSAKIKQAWLDPERKKKHVAALNTPAVTEKRRSSLQKSAHKLWQSSEHRNKMLTALHTPESRQKRKEAVAKTWAIPGRKEAHAELLKQMWKQDHFKAKVVEGLKKTWTPERKKRQSKISYDMQLSCDLPARSDSASGVRGVRWLNHIKKWQARVGIGGNKQVCAGVFVDVEDAKSAYAKAKAAVAVGRDLGLFGDGLAAMIKAHCKAVDTDKTT